MRYLLLAWCDESAWEGMAEGEAEVVIGRCTQLDDILPHSGHVLAMAGLQHSRNSLIVTTASGRTRITDGPVTSSREQIGAFYLIEARDLNEALHVASRTAASLPGVNLGWRVEVRAVEDAAPGPHTRHTLRNA